VYFKSVKPTYLILTQTVSPRKKLVFNIPFHYMTKYEKENQKTQSFQK